MASTHTKLSIVTNVFSLHYNSTLKCTEKSFKRQQIIAKLQGKIVLLMPSNNQKFCLG